jgi:hypothetical protein
MFPGWDWAYKMKYDGCLIAAGDGKAGPIPVRVSVGPEEFDPILEASEVESRFASRAKSNVLAAAALK